MKRDWDIIREIMLKVEELPNDHEMVKLTDFPDDQHFSAAYNAQLLVESGLVKGHVIDEMGRDSKPANFFLQRLTWEGHELLDTIRSETVWSKTKESFLSRGLDMTFDLVKSVASDIATSLLKQAVGIA